MHKTMSERPGVGGTSPNFQYGGSARDKKWTQPDLKFCKNERSIRSITNEKEGQLNRKYCDEN